MTTGRKILIVALLLLPVLLVAVFSILQTRKQLIADIYKERSTQASLSTGLLKAKLDHLTDIGKAFASRPVFRQYIAEKKWDKAIELMQEVPAGFNYITTVTLADSKGRIMASTYTDGINNPSNHDTIPWFRQIDQPFTYHLTGVYKNQQHPQKLVNALTTPVYSSKGELTAMLVLEVNIRTLLDWSTGISIGKSGFIYIVDKNGHIAASPALTTADSIIDYSSVPAVQKALAGEKNVAVLYNPVAKEYRLSAFEGVSGYGWAVIVQEEAAAALSVTKKLWPVFIFFSLVVLMAAGLAAFIIREIIRRNKTAADLRTYTDMVENTRVVIRNMKNEIIFWNRGMERLYGWKKEEAIGKTTHQLFASVFLQPVSTIEETLLNSNLWQGEIKHARKDGSIIYVSSHWSLIRDTKGHPFAVIETNNDITELKKAEEKVEALSIQINQSNDAIYTVDAQRLIKSWNRGAEKLYGYSLEEAVGNESNRLLQTALSESAIDLAVSQLSKEDYWSGELKRKTKHGNTIDVYSSTTTVRAADGTINGYVAVSIDITEQVKLREQISYLAALVDHSADAIASVSMEIKILSWNRGAEALLGFTSTEAIGKTPRELGIIDLSVERQDEIFYGVMANGYWQFEMNFCRKDGSNFFGAINASPVKNKHGVNNGVVFIIKDISERKRLEDQLTKYNTELEERIQLRTGELYASEKKFRALIENNYDAIILIDKSFKTIYRSPSATRMTGWSDEETLFIDRFTNTHPDDIDLVNRVSREALSRPGQPVPIRFRFRHKLGHYVWLEGVVTNWFRDKNIGAFVLNTRDVTEKVATEDKLQGLLRELSEYRYALDQSGIVSITDHRGIIRHVNDNFCHISQYTQQELIGMEHRMVNSGHHSKEFFRQLWSTIQEGSIWKGEIRNRAKDGSFFWLDTTIVPFADNNGKPFQYIALRSDITLRKDAEEKLLSSEKRFRTIIENNYEAILLIDESLNTVYRTPSATRITGWSDEEMLNNNAVKIVHPDDLEKAADVMKLATMNPGKPFNTLFRSLHKDGYYVWIDATIVNRLNDENIKAFVFNYREVTERIKAEEKLQASENRFRSLIENVSDGIVLTDSESGIIYQSPSVTRITGYQPEERKGKRPADYVHPEDYPMLVEFNERLSSTTDTALPFQYRFQHKKGHYIWLEGWVRNLLHEPAVNAYVSNYRDITERKEAEVALQESEKMFRSLFENILNGFAYCRVIMNNEQVVDFVYESVNSAFEAITGITGTIGKKHSEVFPGLLNSDPEYAAMLTRIILTRQPEKFESYIPPLEKWLSVAIYSPNDTHFVSLIENISERKKSEQNIQELNTALEEKVAIRTKELTKVNEELEAFSYSVSHDLRAPLRGIIGFTAILEEEYAKQLDDEARRITGIIKHNTLKMGNLIDDLLFFSRMGRHQIELAEIDTNEMVQTIITELDSSIHKSSQNAVDWVIGSLHFSYGDISAIRQVWTNLLSNAVKYSGARPKPKVEIQSYLKEDQLVFMIKDNGAGFDQKYSHKLFKVFQRLHAADEFEGTGVGLAIVDKIISKHGGKVWAEGVVGEGAAFYFSLPAGKTQTNNSA